MSGATLVGDVFGEDELVVVVEENKKNKHIVKKKIGQLLDMIPWAKRKILKKKKNLRYCYALPESRSSRQGFWIYIGNSFDIK